MESYWQRGWTDRWVEAPPGRVDFAVIGGGFAGLATAIRIREREPSASIVVLEADRVGAGASGRSAGFLSPLAAPVWVLGAQHRAKYAWAAARMHREMHGVARWLEKIAPRCELAPVRYQMRAAGRLWNSALHVFADAMDGAGIPYRDVGGAIEMDAYTLHPYLLVQQLAEHAAGAGIHICEHAAVKVIESGGVMLASGRTVAARRVVACTNAYSSSMVTADRVRAFVVHSCMAASMPVGAEDGFTLTFGRAQTYRRTHAGRILGGGLDGLRAPDLARAFGLIGGAPGDIAWSGKFQTTATGLPIIRRDKTCMWNVGYGGTGAMLALACAPIAAAAACDGEPSDLAKLVRETRVPVLDTLRALGRIAWGYAMPWSGAAVVYKDW